MLLGSQIARYQVLRLLGEGGMGSVYLVEHIDLKTRHAIKVLLPHLSKHPEIVQRFRNEARAAAATKSPNIVAVRDFGQLHDGSWYLVMDYWEGATLTGFLASRGALPHRVLARIAIDALNGLAAAHKKNIIHRDLKPDNLYLANVDDDVRAMILDFGVCRLGEEAGLVTRTGAVIGTPMYMSPEQFRGQPIDHRADLWSLGAVLYEAATGGSLPYHDEGAPRGQVLEDAVLRERMFYPPVDPQRRNSGIPRPLADAILKLIDPDPSKRPENAAAAAILIGETLLPDQSGIEMLQKRAPDLLHGSHIRETVRQLTVLGTHDLPSGRYAIRSKLGSGGMAEVFRADTLGAEGFAHAVALKRVLPGYSEVPAFATMFCEEARLASQLHHPNIVSVLDFDRDPDGRLFLVMEYVAGKDLGAVLDSGRLPPAMAIFVVSEMLRGLGYAHALPNPSAGISGVVHRDISPHNVLVSWEGAVKVSDFGIAKALGVGSGLGSGMVRGKPAYVSPEQANAETLDGRSDLFSVGVVLWEALTGTRLFKGDSAKETFGQIMFRDSPRPSSVRPGIPADVEAVVMKLLARDRNARYATAEQAIEDLARCDDNPRNGRSDLVRLLASRFPAEVKARSQGHSTSGPTALPREAAHMVATAPLSTLGTAASQSSPRPSMRTYRRRWMFGALAAAVVAVATLAVVVVATRASRASDPTSVTVAATPNPGNGAQVHGTHPVVVAAPRERVASTSDASIPAPDAGIATAVVVAAHLDASVAGSAVDAATSNAVAVATQVPTPPRQPDPGVIDTPQAVPVTPPLPAPRARVEKGKVHIYVAPFAQVWIDDATEPVGETPLHLELRVGSHRIHLGKRKQKLKTVVVTVSATKEARIDETW